MPELTLEEKTYLLGLLGDALRKHKEYLETKRRISRWKNNCLWYRSAESVTHYRHLSINSRKDLGGNNGFYC